MTHEGEAVNHVGFYLLARQSSMSLTKSVVLVALSLKHWGSSLVGFSRHGVDTHLEAVN